MRASRAVAGRAAALAAALIACFATMPARADAGSAEDRLRDQLRQTVLQMRQTEDENAELKARLDTASQQAAAQITQAAKKQPSADSPRLRRQLQEQTAKVTALEQQLDATQKSLEQWKQANQQVTVLARTRDSDARKLDAELHEAAAHAQSCEDKNAQLVKISDDLLQRYKNKGVWESMRDNEPFTQLHRVALEKLAQDYHGQIVDSTLPPAGGEAH